MRKKTETKLEQIVAIAARLFVERGYEATSMSEIAAAPGGSKATLYNYFPSKKDIFTEVMLRSGSKLGGHVFEGLSADLPLNDRLLRFGTDYLGFILSQPMIDIRRTVMAELHKVEDIGKDIYERGLKKKWANIEALLEQAMADGILRTGDPWLAAMQLRGLLEADWADQRLLGVKPLPTRAQTASAAKAALDVFWAFYGQKA